VNASAGATRRLAVGEDVLPLDDEELGRLVEALAGLDLHEAEAVADQIAALRLAGGVICLTPTEAEIAALELALEALMDEARPLGPALSRLASICAEDPSGEGRGRAA
jgi:ABC-type transport system involved in cytochrome c biogenesis ATPase subunit